MSSRKAIVLAAAALAAGSIAYVLFTRKQQRPIALDPNAKVALKLVKKTVISYDTRLFRFALQVTRF